MNEASISSKTIPVIVQIKLSRYCWIPNVLNSTVKLVSSALEIWTGLRNYFSFFPFIMQSLYTRIRKCQPFDVIDIFQSSLRGHPNCEISMVYFSELVNHVSWHGYLTVPVRCGPIRKLQITWNLSSKTYAADFMIAPLWNYWWQKYYFFVFFRHVDDIFNGKSVINICHQNWCFELRSIDFRSENLFIWKLYKTVNIFKILFVL